MKKSHHEVKHRHHSDMSTILKLGLKCLAALMLTGNVYFVEVRRKFEKLERFKDHIFESPFQDLKESPIQQSLVNKHLNQLCCL